MSFELVLYSSGVHARVSKRAGGAGKWSEVCGGHFLSLLDLSPGLQTRPRRTSHLLSEEDPSLWRRMAALRRRGSTVSAQSGSGHARADDDMRHATITA